MYRRRCVAGDGPRHERRTGFCVLIERTVNMAWTNRHRPRFTPESPARAATLLATMKANGGHIGIRRVHGVYRAGVSAAWF
jgi:hypothetical protein